METARQSKMLGLFTPQDVVERLVAVSGQLTAVKAQADSRLAGAVRTLRERVEHVIGQPAKPKTHQGHTGRVNRARTEELNYQVHPDARPPKAGDRTFKRLHKDGHANDPYTLMPDGRPMGAERGKMPKGREGLKNLPKNHDALVKDGWPNLNGKNARGEDLEDFKNFKNARPDTLPRETRIYRIVDENARDPGGYWSSELPKNKAAWRRDYAVKDSWNDNGYFVEYEVTDPKGLKVWRGETAGQEYEDRNFHLTGGKEQIFVAPDTLKTSKPKLTLWPEL